MTAPKPTIPRLQSNTTAKLTRTSRGARLTVNRIRKQTGCDAVWSFHEPDECDGTAESRGLDTSRRERATQPSEDLVRRVARLDPNTGLPREGADEP